MSAQARLILLLWLPIVFVILISFKPRTAIIISYIVGILFLPKSVGINVPGLATYAEDKATSYAILVGLFFLTARGMVSSKSLIEYTPKWLDLPVILAFVVSPMASSLSNDLGANDAIKEAAEVVFLLGVPYFLGRIYINNLSGIRELSINIIKGGIIYIPLCLYEIRSGPFLHSSIYGYFAHSSGIFQAMRWGGWRPMVFMQHGLVLAMWMTSSTIIAVWLWKTKTFKTIWQIPKTWIVAALLVAMVLIKSTGAYGYIVFIIISILVARLFKLNITIWLLIFLIVFYLGGRVSGRLSEKAISSLSASIFPEDRSQSLVFRLDNEEILTYKALQRPIFGWGGWGRSRVSRENWDGGQVDASVVDSFWVYTLGTGGLFGLITLYLFLLMPVVLFLLRYPVITWFEANIAPAAALMAVLVVFTWDTMFNAAVLAIFPLICGSLSSILVREPVLKSRKKLSKKLT